MISKIIKKLMEKRHRTYQSAFKAEQKGAVYLTQTTVYGKEDSSVIFVNKKRGLKRMLIDKDGFFVNFPGIEKEDFWVSEISENDILPRVRFHTRFEKQENGWLILWEIRPDGRYWADDGFGIDNSEEITLYTFVNMEGCFTAPFKIYNIGSHNYMQEHEQHIKIC